MRFLFAGYISKISPEETGEGQLFKYEVEASDYSYILNNKIARRAYTNRTLNYIVTDLMGEYVAASYGFNLTNVATGPTISSVTFDHISIRKCFEKLQKLTGYVWYVDYEKKLYFTTQSATAAPESITDSSDNFEDITINYDTSQVRNSVIVIGSDDGEQSATTVTQTFEGDGTTRAWQLEDKPSEVVSITLNSVSKQFSLDLNERDTDVFVYSFEGMSFRLTDDQTTPVGGGSPDQIVITYYPRVPIIVRRTNPASIAAFAALDGGDGVYEYTIKEPSITSKAEAAARALQELDEFSEALVNGQFTTRTSLLSGGSIFQPGQYVVVNLPTYGISTEHRLSHSGSQYQSYRRWQHHRIHLPRPVRGQNGRRKGVSGESGLAIGGSARRNQDPHHRAAGRGNRDRRRRADPYIVHSALPVGARRFSTDGVE